MILKPSLLQVLSLPSHPVPQSIHTLTLHHLSLLSFTSLFLWVFFFFPPTCSGAFSICPSLPIHSSLLPDTLGAENTKHSKSGFSSFFLNCRDLKLLLGCKHLVASLERDSRGNNCDFSTFRDLFSQRFSGPSQCKLLDCLWNCFPLVQQLCGLCVSCKVHSFLRGGGGLAWEGDNVNIQASLCLLTLEILPLIFPSECKDKAKVQATCKRF